MLLKPWITGPVVCYGGAMHGLHCQLELCYGLDVAHVGPASPWQVGGEEEMGEPGGVLSETLAHLWGDNVMSRAQFWGRKSLGSG